MSGSTLSWRKKYCPCGCQRHTKASVNSLVAPEGWMEPRNVLYMAQTPVPLNSSRLHGPYSSTNDFFHYHCQTWPLIWLNWEVKAWKLNQVAFKLPWQIAFCKASRRKVSFSKPAENQTGKHVNLAWFSILLGVQYVTRLRVKTKRAIFSCFGRWTIRLNPFPNCQYYNVWYCLHAKAI